MTTQDKTAHKPTARRLSLRPRSVTNLLLISFTLVILPVLTATLFSTVYVDRLTRQSEHIVHQGIQITRTNKQLDSLLTGMERSARRYRILHDDALVEKFSRQKGDLDDLVQQLMALQIDTLPAEALDTLTARADTITSAMHKGPDALDRVLPLFLTMHHNAVHIAERGSRYVNQKLQRLQKTTGEARLFLMVCLFALIPGIILLAVISTIIIARPVRQVIRAITRLGEGDFEHPITIATPSEEFDALGSHLEWMRQRLATLEDERNQFVRNMSHELKTPLASIRQGSELLHDETAGPLSDGQADIARIIHHNSLELQALIENLLDFSARQQKRSQLTITPIEMQPFLAGIVERQALTIHNKNLTVNLSDEPITVHADKQQLHLIVDNLLSNAVKFSPQGGTIDIQAEHRSGQVVLSLCDEGPGIAAQEHEHIFDPFFQGRSTAEHAAVKGTGIGLSVVKECVEAHKGSIEIVDATDGGACFIVRLPDREMT